MLIQVIVFFIILKKQEEECVLTQIMPFIDPHRHERYHSRKLLAWEVIIVMDESNNKHVKGNGQGSHDAFQNNYGELVDNSTPFSC